MLRMFNFIKIYSEINISEHEDLKNFTKTKETIDKFINAIDFISWFKNETNKQANLSRTILCIIDSGK